MPTKIKVVIYARYSPRPLAGADADGELPPDSNAKQIERCKAYAADRGYEIDEKLIFSDKALTGLDLEQDPDPTKSVTKRPNLLAAIAATKKGMVLLVRWRNRIARDPYVQGWARRKIMKQGGRIEATDEANAEGLAGELLDNTLATVDKYRAIQIGIDTAIAMVKHQKHGRRMGRKDCCPFGFMPDPADSKRLIKSPEEQQTIRIVMRMHLFGVKPPTICKRLDQAGRQRRGKKWAKARSTVRAIIERHSADEEERGNRDEAGGEAGGEAETSG